MSSRFRFLLLHSARLVSSNVGLALLAFLQGIVIARNLAVTSYGMLGVLNGSVGMIQSLIGFRTSEALTNEIVSARQANDNARLARAIATSLLVDLFTRLVSAVLILCTADSILQVVGLAGYELRPLLIATGFAAIFSCCDACWFSVARDSQRYREIALVPLFCALVNLLLVVLGAWFHMLTLQLVVIISLFVAGLRGALQLILLARILRSAYQLDLVRLPLRTGLQHPRALIGYWRFMWTGFMTTVVSSSVKQGDIVLVNLLASTEQAGLYRLAKNLIGTLQVLVNSFSAVIYQQLTEFVIAKNWREIVRLCRSSTLAIAPLILIMVVGFAFLGRPLIVSIFGEQFRDAFEPSLALLLGASISMLLFWAHPLMLAMRRFNWMLVNSLLVAGGFFWSAFILIPRWQATGGAAAYGAAWAIGYLLALLSVSSAVIVGNRAATS